MALPAIIDQLSLAFVGFVTIKIVSGLGAEAVAGIVAAERVFFLAGGLMFCVSTGATALVAQSWGAKNYREVDRVTKLALCTSGISAITISALTASLGPLLISTLDLDLPASRYAREFIVAISPFYIFYGLASIFGAVLRAAGDAYAPLKINVLANIVNVFLSYALVNGVWFIPGLQLLGAALANGCSFALCAFIYCIAWKRNRLRVSYFHGMDFFNEKRLFQLLRISGPSAVEVVSFNFGMSFVTYLFSVYGIESIVSYGMLAAILTVVYVVGVGASVATAANVGHLVGAREFEKIPPVVSRALMGTVSAMFTIALLLYLTSDEISRYLNANEAIAARFRELLLVHVFVLPLMAIEFVYRGLYRGMAKTSTSMNIALSGLGMRGIVGGVSIAFGLNLYFVYAAILGDYVLRALIYWRLRSLDSRQIVPVPST